MYWLLTDEAWHAICYFFQVNLDANRTKVVDFSIIWSSTLGVEQYKSFLSTPEFVEFPTLIPGQKAYAYFYPPSNPNFQGLPDEKPPLLVKVHGKWTTKDFFYMSHVIVLVLKKILLRFRYFSSLFIYIKQKLSLSMFSFRQKFKMVWYCYSLRKAKDEAH